MPTERAGDRLTRQVYGPSHWSRPPARRWEVERMGNGPIVPKALHPGDPVRVSGAEVRQLDSAPSLRGRGKPSGLGYDPATGEEVRSSTYVDHATRESTGETDVFTLVSHRGYSEERFYTRSLNADGHGERITIRVPQGLDSQIMAAVSMIPEYRSTQDLFRDSVVHRLEFLQKRYNISDAVRRMLELERITADIRAGSAEAETLDATVEGLKESLDRIYNQKDWAMMAAQLEQGEDMVEWLREPYKSRAKEAVTGWKQVTKDHLLRLEQERGE